MLEIYNQHRELDWNRLVFFCRDTDLWSPNCSGNLLMLKPCGLKALDFFVTFDPGYSPQNSVNLSLYLGNMLSALYYFSLLHLLSNHFQRFLCRHSSMNMRQLHILFNSAKTWHVDFCVFPQISSDLPELNLKLFCSDVKNNFRFS